jgi:DNA-binding transcriptional LysR family regulator
VAVVSTAKYFVPRLLGSFCEQHPGVDISLEVLNRDRVVQRLRENLDDLYVLSQPPADMDLADHAILSNPLVLIASGGHPLSGRKRIALSALQGERFILRESGSGTRLSTDRFFRQQAFVPERLLELGSNEAIKEAVAGHLGVAILSQHALRTEMDQGELCILPVTGFPIRSHWHAVYPRARQLSPVAEVFLKSLLAQAQP